MDLRKEIAKLLGLGEEAEPEQILEALRAALSEAKALREGGAAETVAANKAVLAALGLEDGAALEAVTGRIEALKAAPPADRGMEEKVLKLERQLADRDAEDAVALAFKAGKISAAQKPWAKSYALKDPAGFAQYVENAPMAVPLGTLTFAPGERALKADVLDDGTVLACKLTGVTLDDVKKYGLEG